MNHSNTRRRSSKRPKIVKPAKPHPDFPLFPHASGRWAKKVRGKLHYFGPWRDPDAALARWVQQKDRLLAGLPPLPDSASPRLTVRDLLNHFLTSKQRLIDRGERCARYQSDLRYTANRIAKVFGLDTAVEHLGPADFARLAAEMAKTLGPVARRTEIHKTRSVFKYALDAGLIDQPIRYGPDFQAPSETILRKHRQRKQREHGLRMFEPGEIRRLLAVVAPELRAMILLGINCGFGNSDCATLSLANLDLAGGWIDHPRPKTGVERRCPLWDETVEALRLVLERRPEPRDNAHAGLVFLTRRKAQPYVRLTKKRNPTDPIGQCLDVHLKALGIKRPGLSFYSLRHTFETVAGEIRDQVAVDCIMGHADRSMAGQYRERVDDSRLVAVTDHVRAWLFGTREAK